MSAKVETPELVNPFTRPPLTDEERALMPPRSDRETTFTPLASAAPVTKAEKESAAKAIDDRIRKQAAKVVLAATRFADDHNEDMDTQELRVALSAQQTDKDAPIGLKVALKVFESFQKQTVEDARPTLAIQINFGGEPIAYPKRVIEEDS